ncbi:hypothetical protein LZ31DRAFT_108842 [Colletotrichum somersetense]|nr:hypothetical protein LZ31DRAFT_108842 [Colletotrichum somersetense]
MFALGARYLPMRCSDLKQASQSVLSLCWVARVPPQLPEHSSIPSVGGWILLQACLHATLFAHCVRMPRSSTRYRDRSPSSLSAGAAYAALLRVAINASALLCAAPAALTEPSLGVHSTASILCDSS